MKKLFVAVLSALALVSAQSASATDIGVTWQGKSGMAKRILAGFQERMGEIAADVKLEVVPEQADAASLKAVVDRFQSEKQGMLVLRSSGSKYFANNPPSIPGFVGGTNHPATLGAMKNMDAPEGNVTGVTYFIPHVIMIESFMALYPDLTSALLVLEKGHPGAPLDEKGVMAACEELVIDCTVAYVDGAEGVAVAIKNVAASVSAVLLGNQAAIFDNADKYVSAAGKIPMFAFSKSAVTKGALAGFSANDHKLGRMLADSVVDVVVKGKAIKDTPVKTDPEPVFHINTTVAATIGIEVPFQMKESANLIK
jgi:putative tryptophan/tyrosine transport system substrate-binding protein